jgi:GT2 family glycosyltransferase
LKGFDADFFAHQEEIDLCWRAFNKGYKIKYIWESAVFHVGGATLQQGNPRKTYLNFRNSLLMLTKNLPEDKLYWILFCRMVLDAIAGLQFILQGKFNHFMAILKAHGSFYRLFSVHYRKRDKFQSEKYYNQKSIVYLYFVKKVRIFKHLFNS